jgi:hypothetical protein
MFFTNRVINTWNNLSEATVNAKSLNAYIKNCIDKEFALVKYTTNFGDEIN